jgi:autotransporter-associated beta strand protein
MTMPFLPTRKLGARKFPAARLTPFFAAISALFFVAAMNDAHAQETVYWRNVAANGNWANTDASDINNWYRTGNGWDVRRPDLANNQWSVIGTPSYNIIIFDNGTQATTTVNAGANLGPTNFSVYRLWLQNSTSRTFNSSGGGYLEFGGGTGNAQIETQAGATGSYTFNVPLNLTKTTEINALNGDMTFGSSSTITNSTAITSSTSSGRQVTFQGVISGAGSFNHQGAGQIVLGAANTYTGATTIEASGGRIQIENSSALGGTGTGTTVSSGAALQIFGSLGTISEGLTLNGTGISSGGALRNISGNSTWSGAITLASASRINSDAGTLTIDPTSGNAISGSFNLTLGGAGNITINDPIATSSGTLTKDGTGQVNLAGNNTYTGATTISAGVLEAQHANALGTTANGTTVSSGAALKLYSGTGISYSAEALSLSGVGVGGADGALRNVGGTNTWNGAITLSGNSRINADNTSSSPASSLTVAGNITGGANVLFLGANGGNLFISGAISGGGASQDTTTTSIFKDGANNLTLSGNNSYSGDTRLVAGSLTVAAGGTLGNGESDVFISSGATLNVNTNVTVDSIRETGNNNGGVIAIGNGAVLTVDGADKGTFYQNSISGAGGLTMAGSGNTTLGLYGTQSYTGTTTVTSGKLSSGFALSTTNVTVTGGQFETTAANILADTASVIVNGGTFTLGGNDTIGALSGSGGTFALGANALTTSTSDNTSFAGALTGSGAVVKQGTGSLTLSGANTATGGLFIDNGAVTLGGGSVSFSGIEIGGGVNGNPEAGDAATLRVTSGTFSTGITVDGNTNSSGVAGTRTIEFANSTGSATLSGAVTAEKTFTANVATGAATGVLSGAISGAGGLTKTGDGTITLSGASANTYSMVSPPSALAR